MHKLLLAFALALPAWAHESRSSCEAQLLAKLRTADFHEVLAQAPDVRAAIVALLHRRDPSTQSAIDEQLTRAHAHREMSFQVKNPATGNYDKFVEVPVNGEIAPLLNSDFQRLVKSTEPVMQALRKLLQKIYSGKPLTVENLGLSKLPKAEAELALKVISDSIYLEPAMQSPSMADYPFLAVAGFDGAIVDPMHPKPDFFEFNLGTPSGLSNNIQMLDDLRVADRELWNVISPYLGQDDTFIQLRHAIESNALAWTHRIGLSVVISPGIYNGAHPDVVMIARGTGLPLVKSSDLYEGEDGWIHFNQGLGKDDPVVTGIYGRMEESFFLQSNQDGIPMISPNNDAQAELAKKLGLNLRPGAVYEHVYNENGELVDLVRDSKGEPKFLEVWDSIAKDPSRPQAPKGSFAAAIRDRKLYYSALGGRVVDDKRLFPLISKYLVSSIYKNNLAKPIESLSLDQYTLFFAAPDLFVVKAPDKSGGSGIHFPMAMADAERRDLIEQVKEHPEAYKIEYISTIATLPSMKDGKINEPMPVDLRIFVTMDARGRVSAGKNSLLLRTAASGGLYSNTSMGGGYGIGVVLDERVSSYYGGLEQTFSPNERYMSVSHVADLRAALDEMKELVMHFDQGKDSALSQKDVQDRAMNLSFRLRGLMDLIEFSNLNVIPLLRGYAQSTEPELLQRRLQSALESTLNLMVSRYRYHRHDREKNNSIEEFAVQNRTWLDEKRNDVVAECIRYTPIPITDIRPLKPAEVSYWFADGGNWRSEKVELAEYLKVEDPIVQSVIDEVRAAGGQVRLLRSRRTSPTGIITWQKEGPYFWVNLNRESSSYLIPVIAIDLAQSGALPALMHELQHFRMWKEFNDRFIGEGASREKAAHDAVDAVWTVDNQILGEQRAVSAEMQAEKDHPDHPLSRVGFHRPLHFYERGYVNRVTYPQFEAIRQHLRAVKWQGQDRDEALLERIMSEAVTVARDTKEKAVAHWRDRSFATIDGEEARGEMARAQLSSIFELLVRPYGMERLEGDQTVQDFMSVLRTSCDKLGISQEECFGTRRRRQSQNDQIQ